MKLQWTKVAYMNEGGRWIEWHIIHQGMRCSRLGRSHFSIWKDAPGRDWHDLPRGRQVKLTMANGQIIDVGLPTDNTAEIKLFLSFAFQCLRGSNEEVSPDEPIQQACGLRLKQMACKFNFYEHTHPEFGHHFRGTSPDVSVALLTEMIHHAIHARTVRIVGPVLDFDPKD